MRAEAGMADTRSIASTPAFARGVPLLRPCAGLAAKMPMGNGLDENNVLGPLQNKKQFDIVSDLVEDACQPAGHHRLSMSCICTVTFDAGVSTVERLCCGQVVQAAAMLRSTTRRQPAGAEGS